eukprot:scaffold37376_cov229-Amphora_coffeaeformis.AAC.1
MLASRMGITVMIDSNWYRTVRNDMGVSRITTSIKAYMDQRYRPKVACRNVLDNGLIGWGKRECEIEWGLQIEERTFQRYLPKTT